jgi:hypothetical protein
VRAAGNEPGLSLDGKATGLNLEPLIAAQTAGEPNFSGKPGNFDLNLAGRGRTVIENVKRPAANVSFEIANGAIKGFNLGRTLCAAYNVTQGAPAPPDLPPVTAFEGIHGSAVVAAGTATSKDMLARTKYMDANGAGTLGLVISGSTTSSARSSRGQSGFPMRDARSARRRRGAVHDPRHGDGARDQAGLRQAGPATVAGLDPRPRQGSVCAISCADRDD